MSIDYIKHGNLTLEKHLVTTQDNETISLIRIPGKRTNNEDLGQSILCLHGSFSNFTTWISTQKKGLGYFLHDNNFDVWMLEFRGHGFSPKSDKFSSYLAEDWAKYDIPCAQNYIYQLVQQPVLYLTHSAGGVALLTAMSGKFLDQAQIKGACIVAGQTSHGYRIIYNPFVYYTLKTINKFASTFNARALGLGPENESFNTIFQMIRWRYTQTWTTRCGMDAWKGLSNITIPILNVCSDGDTQDPVEGVKLIYSQLQSEKQILQLGINHGHKKNYTHIGMLIDPQAKQEIYPLILQWFLELNEQH
jgi:esterase/lipase